MLQCNGLEGQELEPGGMAEWTKAVVLKTTVAVMSPGVRIPLPPPVVARSVTGTPDAIFWGVIGGGRIARSSAPAC